MDINEVFGKKVLERRLSLKISQETLANMADIIEPIYLILKKVKGTCL